MEQPAFYLLPMVVRTSALVGQTPLLKGKLTRDHFSAMGGITSEGEIIMQCQDHAYRDPNVVRFLQLLTREIASKLLMIWDVAPIHRSQPVKDYLSNGGARQFHLEQLPAYVPELNPQEGAWNLLKRVELKNICRMDW